MIDLKYNLYDNVQKIVGKGAYRELQRYLETTREHAKRHTKRLLSYLKCASDNTKVAIEKA